MAKKSRRFPPLKRMLRMLIFLVDHRFGGTIYDLMEEGGLNTRRQAYRYLEIMRDMGIEFAKSGGGLGTKVTYRLANRERWAVLAKIAD